MKFSWVPPFFVSTGKFDLSQGNGTLYESNGCLAAVKHMKQSYRSLINYEVVNPNAERSENITTEKVQCESSLEPAEVVKSQQNSNNIQSCELSLCSPDNTGELSRNNDSVVPPAISTKNKKSSLSTRISNQKRVGVSAGSMDDFAFKSKKKEGVCSSYSDMNQTIDSNDVKLPKYEKDEESEEFIKIAIMNNEFLREGMKDKEVMQAVVDAMYMEEKPENSYVIREGEIGFHLYVLARGSIEVYKDNAKIATLEPGRIFGELALLYNTKRNASIKAITPCILWVLDRKDFNHIVRRVINRRIDEYIKYLRSVPILQNLEKDVLKKMTELLKIGVFPSGTCIIKQGEEGNLFYIITSGTVAVTVKYSEEREFMLTAFPGFPVVTRIYFSREIYIFLADESEKTVGKLGKGDFFGEGALMAKEKRTATVIAQTDVECLTLDREPFIEFLGGLKEVQEVIKSRNAKLKNVKEKTSEYSYIKLKDLEVKGTLGIGGFGRVELVQYKNNRHLTFALKKLKKSHVVEFQQQHHVLNEKAAMLCCQSPFIAKLHNTYKDNKYLYFLMEACLGGDVWSLLQKRRFFDEKSAKFITACVVEAFQYLHDRGIVYRDLKPENLLFDSKGYVKLVDFGFAKKLNPTEKTWTFAGTPEYLAPEIFLNKGHDRAVDYWALGVFIYELSVGKPPFRGLDQMKTYNLIMKGINSVPFPKFITKSAELLIKKLCKIEPTERLGYQKEGILGIKHQRWFSNFDWVSLQKTEMKAPFIPKVNGPTDLSNFDECPKDKEIPPDDFGDWDMEF